jgi:hypothetical protein
MECSGDWKQMSAFAGLLIVEAWLGKTNKIKSSSTLELLVNLGLSLVKRKTQGDK